MLRMVKLAELLVVLAVASPIVPAATSSLIAVFSGKLEHLDVSGNVLNVIPGDSRTPAPQWYAWDPFVTTDPHNRTVCWVEADQDRKYEDGGWSSAWPGILRCYALGGDPTATWSIKMPRWLQMKMHLRRLEAVAFDGTTHTWHLTIRTDYPPRLSSFVCSYRFNKCLKLKSVTDKFMMELTRNVAYDMKNRLLISIDSRRLQSTRLDGSGTRVLPVTVESPTGLTLDPVGRHIYWLQGRRTLTRVDYDGLNMKQVNVSTSQQLPVAVDFPGAVVFANSHGWLSVVRVKEDTDTAERWASRGAVRELIDAQQPSLRLIQVIPDLGEEAESAISSCQHCQDICVPTLVDGVANTTCFCQQGYEIAQLECKKRQRGSVVVAGAHSLQAVDLQTEQMYTILSGLTNATKVDYLWEGGERFQLFWLDDGSLFRGDWILGGEVTSVQPVVQATYAEKIIDVAADWYQRNLLWLRMVQHPEHGSLIGTEMAALNGSFVRTLIVGRWEGQNQDLALHRSGRYSVFVEDRHLRDMHNMWSRLRGGSVTCYPLDYDYLRNSTVEAQADYTKIVIDTSMPEYENWGYDQLIWIDRSNRTLVFSHHRFVREPEFFLQSEYRGYTTLTHPTFQDAGGLDVLEGRAYWTDRSSGQLWTAYIDTGGGDARPLQVVPGGRGVRVLHPRRQPRAASSVCGDDNGGCSHFCVTGLPGIYTPYTPVPTCTCPNGMWLPKDGKTCRTDGGSPTDMVKLATVDTPLSFNSCPEIMSVVL